MNSRGNSLLKKEISCGRKAMYELILISLLCLSNFIESKLQCPSKCFCNHNLINCSYKSLISLGGVESFVDDADHLDISHNHLSWLAAVRAEHIDASSNLIQIFPKLAPTIQSLLLSGNKLRFISNEDCPDSLKHLDLSENPVQEVDLNCSGLETLNLSNGDIETLPEGFLSKFPSLKTLYLNDNPLKKINGDLRSVTLELLSLERNQLRFLKPSVFSALTKLEVLNISGNRYLHTLQITSAAKVMYAAHCSLETIDLSGMLGILKLDISDNHLSILNLPDSVLELKASNNLIYSVNLRKLKRADLSKNKIVSIQLKSMDWLNISGNRQLSFLKLASIIYLDASECSISRIEGAGSKLHTLNLSSNSLEMFPSGLSLRRLDVSYNRLSSFKSRIEGLEEIKLVGNRLVLAEDVLAQGKMYLSDNPWTCDCKMDHLFKNAEDVKKLICEHPRNVSGKTWSEACYKSKIPKWMLNYPYIPFIISTVLLMFAMFFFYWLRKKLDPPLSDDTQPDESAAERRLTQPTYINDLPSYEEALLMPPIAKKVSVLTQTRSYEVLSRRLSSNSI